MSCMHLRSLLDAVCGSFCANMHQDCAGHFSRRSLPVGWQCISRHFNEHTHTHRAVAKKNLFQSINFEIRLIQQHWNLVYADGGPSEAQKVETRLVPLFWTAAPSSKKEFFSLLWTADVQGLLWSILLQPASEAETWNGKLWQASNSPADQSSSCSHFLLPEFLIGAQLELYTFVFLVWSHLTLKMLELKGFKLEQRRQDCPQWIRKTASPTAKCYLWWWWSKSHQVCNRICGYTCGATLMNPDLLQRKQSKVSAANSPCRPLHRRAQPLS